MAGYEVRCTEATAKKILDKDNSRPDKQSHFQAALGMPMVIDENVEEGTIDVRCNGVLVKQYHI